MLETTIENNSLIIKTLRILLNNTKYRNIMTINVGNGVKNLNHLKKLIIEYTHLNVSHVDVHLFNIEGVELDSTDFDFLDDNQLLYVNTVESHFNTINYLNRFEFIKELKRSDFNESYLAEDQLLDKKVFIKKFNFDKICKKFP